MINRDLVVDHIPRYFYPIIFTHKSDLNLSNDNAMGLEYIRNFQTSHQTYFLTSFSVLGEVWKIQMQFKLIRLSLERDFWGALATPIHATVNVKQH